MSRSSRSGSTASRPAACARCGGGAGGGRGGGRGAAAPAAASISTLHKDQVGPVLADADGPCRCARDRAVLASRGRCRPAENGGLIWKRTACDSSSRVNFTTCCAGVNVQFCGTSRCTVTSAAPFTSLTSVTRASLVSVTDGGGGGSRPGLHRARRGPASQSDAAASRAQAPPVVEAEAASERPPVRSSLPATPAPIPVARPAARSVSRR